MTCLAANDQDYDGSNYYKASKGHMWLGGAIAVNSAQNGRVAVSTCMLTYPFNVIIAAICLFDWLASHVYFLGTWTIWPRRSEIVYVERPKVGPNRLSGTIWRFFQFMIWMGQNVKNHFLNLPPRIEHNA